MRAMNRRLLNCAGKGDLAGVVSALDAGADMNIRDMDGMTALMWAAYWGQTEIADILIQAGTDINIQDKDGNTALMLAAMSGHTGIANSLIQAGADPFIEAEYGRTASDLAKEYGHIQTAEFIEQIMAERKSTELVRSTENVEVPNLSRWL